MTILSFKEGNLIVLASVRFNNLYLHLSTFLILIRLESPSKMAVSFIPPMKLGSSYKPVQELIKTTGEEVPERCTYQLSSKPVDQTDIEYMDSPMIDLSLLSALLSCQHKEELRKLKSVLSSWGCLQLVNHGLSSSLLDQVHETSKGFFALPLDVKQQYKTLVWLEGYGVDQVSEGQGYDWNDRLRLKVYPLDHRNFKLWPEILPKFRETLEEYTMEVRRVLEIILKAIAKLLNLEEDIFLKECGGAEAIDMFTRFNYYKPCSSSDEVLGFKPHSDLTAITILLQDKEVEGLQVEKDGQWFKVPIASNALFVNVGDQLERCKSNPLTGGKEWPHSLCETLVYIHTRAHTYATK
ncbi:protein SRG1-like isoform X2 [Chenopodium quinoa]|uniref:protein SRG1-like isoform X2 n=1 Tax=Chenopodium quinoa TaxID=63459 RepID=UPI000B778714|nr:protein SRG1-like isoform X2 [Chenopodium quinoa]